MIGWQITLLIATSLMAGVGGLFLQGRLTGNVKVLLAFSGAYLFALAVLHLLPEIYIHLGYEGGVFILIGFLVQMVMDYSSRGIEHGHVHHKISLKNTFPLSIYISLFIHSVIEGLPLGGGFEHSHGGHALEVESLLIGIVIHKIPEAIALTALLYHHYSNKRQVLVAMLPYAMATPLGLFIAKFFLAQIPTGRYEGIYATILAITVGIFIHVSTTIIFEADEEHRLSWSKSAAILAGLLLVWLI